ncbi:MAG: methyltransferase domain-containing protein [Myxococcales bacterium]|nr:methyltransferase domain-containing protein [Myxococcales bacterium]
MSEESLDEGVPFDAERAVRERYTDGALARQEDLCCPVSYDAALLAVLPAEILERDYGCGDPSRYVRASETVLDLGSGTGKVCYLAAQIVGATGRVIGVDMNDEMLALARRHQGEIARRIGFANVEFRRGRIQDLGLDLDALDAWLALHPVRAASDLAALDERTTALRAEKPLVADASVDLVISNCVLNLVREGDREKLLAEVFRVLKPGGRVAISDIVCDEDVPLAMKQDPALWSGCISGAYREDHFLTAFAAAGFHGVTLDKYDAAPWKVVEGIEFRAVTVTARKPERTRALDRRHALLYQGPWSAVIDDEGRRFARGVRTAVSDVTFRALTAVAATQLVAIAPPDAAALAVQPFAASSEGKRRDPKETKGFAGAAPKVSCCAPPAAETKKESAKSTGKSCC